MKTSKRLAMFMAGALLCACMTPVPAAPAIAPDVTAYAAPALDADTGALAVPLVVHVDATVPLLPTEMFAALELETVALPEVSEPLPEAMLSTHVGNVDAAWSDTALWKVADRVSWAVKRRQHRGRLTPMAPPPLQTRFRI